MTLLNRTALLQPRPRKFEDVACPELATAEEPHPIIRIQELMAGEVDGVLSSLVDANGKYQRQNYTAKVVAVAAVDENGVRLFTDADIPAIAQMSNGLIVRLTQVAERLSGLEVKVGKSAAGN